MLLWAKPKTLKPQVKTPTSFAIVVDEVTYAKVQAAIESYRSVIEKDGLGTYILVDDWQNPQLIREMLEKLHNDRKMPLEGAVFMGDIPIPMVRDAQFMTSAFKMDQNAEWEDSSVPSDRYYDDFDLRFNYLKQDSINPLFHYVSLAPESDMSICSDIYTGRIKPMARDGKDKYAILERYLQKVVRVKSEENPLDDVCLARGHGYNSQSRDAWAGEQLALKEQLPQVFKQGAFMRSYDYDSHSPLKELYLGLVQRKSADIVLFHHHGDWDTQYLSGYPSGSGMDISMENIKRHLRSRIRYAKESGKDIGETIRRITETTGVPASWIDNALEPEILRQDSIFDANMDIALEDIHRIQPNARFVMFDACYNGSFHLDDCVANAYIFGEGNTVVTQGNTVNALQDKWSDEYLGLLASGVRVGQWGRHVHYLETHIIGDPTYRFSNTANPDIDLNSALTLERKNPEYWKKFLEGRDTDVQSIALRILFENGVEGVDKILAETFRNSESGVLRMECMNLLYRMHAPNLVEILKLAVKDSYELVRRMAVVYIARNGADELIPSFAYAQINETDSWRIYFQTNNVSRMLNMEKLEKEIQRQYAALAPCASIREDERRLIEDIRRNRESIMEIDSIINDRVSVAKEKKFAIERHRNHPAVTTAESLVRFAQDNTRDKELRLKALEALGWYSHSLKRFEIISGCRKLITLEKDREILNEAVKTINRLK